jgi:serine protease Do
VRGVTEDSPASKAGVKAGDVIIEVDGESVESPREISSALRDLDSREFELRVMRERREMALRVTLEERED